MGLGVDPTIETETFGQDNRQWLGSAHGTQATRTGTILADDFIGQNVGGEVLADGDFLPSGVKVGAAGGAPEGVVTLALEAAVDGSQNPVGHLYSGVKLRAGRRIGIAIYDHGKVRSANVPAVVGAAAADAPHIIYL